MSALTHDEYVAKRFLDSIGVKTAQPKASEPVQKAPEPKPQTPIETKTVKPDKNNFQQRMDDELNAQVEFERHPDLFADTPGGWENVQLVLDYVTEHHDGYLSRASVSDAISTLRRRGELLTLFQPEPAAPAKQPEPQAVVQVVQQQQAPSPPKPEDALPELPPYVVRALGSNPLRSKKDIRDMPSALYSHFLKGPHADAFRRRIEAITRR